MPVWRLPADGLASFCRRLTLDTTTLLRWASASSFGAYGGVYGRLDLDNEELSVALEHLGQCSENESRTEYDTWRRQFIAAYHHPSEGDAPVRR